MTTHNENGPDSWDVRIQEFSKIAGLPTQEVEDALAAKPFEITKDTPYVLEMLSDDEVTPFGDFRKTFNDDRDVSLPKLRLGIKYLRGPKEKRETATSKVDTDVMALQSRYGITAKLEDLGAEELLPHYDPQKNNRVTRTLKEMFGDTKVIAFKPDSTSVAIEETINYIVDIGDGLPEENAIEVDGELVRLHPVGAVPDRQFEEDPLFKGHALKRGRSTVNRLDWSDVDKRTRQFVRVIVDQSCIKAVNRHEARQILEDAKKGFDNLKEIYPEEHLIFKEREKRDDLPPLNKILGGFGESTGASNPFDINRSY